MTPAVTLHCDQAIFTSIRGPMGEGYRIVAASRGLRPEEKQAITRLSPSHEALCWQPGNAANASSYAAAFYPLPTGRLCIAYSCYAGAEHTARGGHRVYTHNLVFEERDFPSCAFNPFHVIRAMVAEGLNVPQLTPNSVLPGVRLPINTNLAASAAALSASIDSLHRRYLLQRLFDDVPLIVPVKTGWLESAEALLMGIPGPMRVSLSFGAGLRFSLGRCHRLHVFCDEKGASRSRIAGQPVEYLDPAVMPPITPNSAWLAFIDRHWSRADCAVLARRTSRPFTDLSAAARERIGTLYNAIDAVPQAASLELIALASAHIRDRTSGVEDEIRKELVGEVYETLRRRLNVIRWTDAQALWPGLVTFWRKTATAFAQPLIDVTLRALMGENPLVAVEAALDVASDFPPGLDVDRHGRLLDDVLNGLISHVTPDAEADRLADLCTRWRILRPECAIARKLMDRSSSIHSVPSPHAKSRSHYLSPPLGERAG